VGAGDDAEARLSQLPAVHELAAALDAPHRLAVAAARRAIDEHRQAWLAGQPGVGEVRGDDVEARARELLVELEQPSLRRVINATGVVLHTNLGRAALADEARRAVADAAGYTNLEYQLDTGERGTRHAHVQQLLCELTGSEAAMVVNNGAAAVLLAVAALSGREGPVVVSRGQLVEIGGGFRIPDVIGASGARLIEVGTTNRTRLRDYERAASATDGATILRVHQSNFRTLGFVEDVAIEALCELDVPVIDDVGSGVLTDPAPLPALAEEPSLARSVRAGAALVCSSADKLLGGPQSGLLVGSSKAIAAAREHPLARAMRIDKLSLAALEATLRIYRDPERALSAVPAMAMLAADEAELQSRAERLRAGIGDRGEIVRATARAGGGSLPLLELEGPVIALPRTDDADQLAADLRQADPPVIARIREGRVLLDPRTLSDDEVDDVVGAVRAALGRSCATR
jgi:L-seryl-tRNA(Ser) seleniumtransferase